MVILDFLCSNAHIYKGLSSSFDPSMKFNLWRKHPYVFLANKWLFCLFCCNTLSDFDLLSLN